MGRQEERHRAVRRPVRGDLELCGSEKPTTDICPRGRRQRLPSLVGVHQHREIESESVGGKGVKKPVATTNFTRPVRNIKLATREGEIRGE